MRVSLYPVSLHGMMVHAGDRCSPCRLSPRHSERTALYRLFERHFDDCAREFDERFEDRHGLRRAVVMRSVDQYFECARREGGFARIRRPSCRGEQLLAFFCQTRNFCPSCQAKRAVLFAEP